MKKLCLVIFILISIVTSCKNNNQDVQQTEVAVNHEKYVDFSEGETPDFFTA